VYESHASADRADFFEGNFRVLGILGTGAFSTVYRAQCKADGQEYAVKRAARPFAGYRDAISKLEEVEILWHIRACSHCVQLARAWVQHGYIFLQQELCVGGSLQALLDRVAAGVVDVQGGRGTSSSSFAAASGPGRAVERAPPALDNVESADAGDEDVDEDAMLCSQGPAATMALSSAEAGAGSVARGGPPDGSMVDSSSGGPGNVTAITNTTATNDASGALAVVGIEPLGEGRIWQLLANVATALAEIHGLGMVHLDVKPANIVLVRSWEAMQALGGAGAGADYKLGDFGCAAVLPLAEGEEREGDRTYMAPEVLGEGTYGKQADIFRYVLASPLARLEP
jgi:serine/threonine protein kinase